LLIHSAKHNTHTHARQNNKHTMTYKKLAKSHFTALHALHASPSSQEKAVSPSVCPSVKCVDYDKTEQSSAQILIPYARTFILVF